jgi:hypothetical protein
MVTKEIQFSSIVTIKEFQEQKVLKINASSFSIAKDLIISLILLNENLIDLAALHFTNCSIYLKLNEKISSCNSFNSKAIKLTISKNSLEFFMFYLLKYYRDDISEVSHIDIDFLFNDKEAVTWTIEIDNFNEYSPALAQGYI